MSGVPSWLTELATHAVRQPVPAVARLPEGGGGRRAAILILMGEGLDGPDVLLIQRSSAMRKHAGQPAFPGGAVDPTDDGPVGAALREAMEETGLDPEGVTVVETLPELYLTRSDYRVTPVLGWWRDPCEVYAANPAEVESVERIGVAELVDPANRLTLRVTNRYSGPAFRVRGLLVWGFTAGILDRLLAAGGWERPWDRSRVEDLPRDLLEIASRS
ncbi:NUDIX hydrolase [Rhizohabitans arisaemae]|uniref:NUDIX hydrolase n=1 Tax=Rhizohabitans arisaemae TaxID=2720610 RepID=UPI0024B1CC2E|nr:CoA pyrophosphatase [Rhizohabitans arisaemae]